MDTVQSLQNAGVELVVQPCAQLRGRFADAGLAPRMRIVVAPYVRNLDRLAGALVDLDATLLVAGDSIPLPADLSGQTLKDWQRMAFACDDASVEVVVAETGWLDLLVEV